MSERNSNARWLRPLIIAGTVVLAWSALLIGQQFATVTAQLGEPSPETFVAASEFSIADSDETARLQDEERAAVADLYQTDHNIDALILDNIQALFESVRAGTVVQTALPLPEVSTTTTTLAEEVTTTTLAESTSTTVTDGEGEETTTTTAPTTTTTMVEIVRNRRRHGRTFHRRR